MKWILLVLLVGVVGALGYARFMPADSVGWHVDPLTAEDPSPAGILLVPPEAPVFDMTPEALMAELDRIILGSERTERIAGSVEALHATYLKRTEWLRFPDTTSVRALPAEGGGATVAIYSRTRFGGYDWNVNRTRVRDWLARLDG